MSSDLKLFRVFIASPGGLDEERKAFSEALNDYNRSEAVYRGVLFWPIGWEITLPGIGRPQELINKDIEGSDYFVLILCDRWGSSSGTDAKGKTYSSGTEEEYELACALLDDAEVPMTDISVFFKFVRSEKLNDPGPQLQRVLEFRKRLEQEKKLLFQSFDTVDAYRRSMTAVLAGWLRNIEQHSLGKTIPVAEVNDLKLDAERSNFRTDETGATLAPVESNETQSASELAIDELFQQAYDAFFQGTYDQSRSFFERARKIAKSAKDEIRALGGLAHVEEREARFGDAVPLLVQALKISSAIPSLLDNKISVLLQLSQLRALQGAVAESEAIVDDAVSLARKTDPDSVRTAFALARKAQVSILRYDVDMARQQQTAQIGIRQKNSRQEYVIKQERLTLGLLHVTLGQFKDAMRVLDQVLTEEGKRETARNSLKLLRLKAWCEWRFGNREEADVLFRDCISLAESVSGAGERDLIPFLEDQALFLLQSGKFRECERVATRAVAISRERLGKLNPRSRVHALTLGMLYSCNGGAVESLEIAEAGLQALDEMGISNSPRAGLFHMLRGASLSQLERTEAASHSINAALGLLSNVGVQSFPAYRHASYLSRLLKGGGRSSLKIGSWRHIIVGPLDFSL